MLVVGVNEVRVFCICMGWVCCGEMSEFLVSLLFDVLWTEEP